MTWKTHTVELITPCFCAGADPNRAEIRPPSIRGEWRWWFRVLGGTAEQERAVFGGVRGTASRSRVSVRCTPAVRPPEPFRLPSMTTDSPLAYIWYFANASGKAKGEQYGPRFSEQGILPPGTTFTLALRNDPLPSQHLDTRLADSLQALFWGGAIGYRATRAAGAWDVTQSGTAAAPPSIDAWRGFFDDHGIQTAVVSCDAAPLTFDSWKPCVCVLESALKNGLRKLQSAGRNDDRPSPLGSATPRQRSGVRLRPVRIGDTLYACALYTPGVLGDASVIPSFSLRNITFEHGDTRGNTTRMVLA